MLLFQEEYKPRPFQEVLINGQNPQEDDEDPNNTPTDYTAGDDEGAETTPAPDNPPNPTPEADDTNPEDNPEDYTVPDDDGETPPSGNAATDARANTQEGIDNQPTDYTTDTTGVEPAAAEAPSDADTDQGAGETGEGTEDNQPADYTTGGGDPEGGGGDPDAAGGDSSDAGGDPDGGGGDPETGGGGAEGDMGDDYGDDSSSGDSYDSQIEDLEKEIFSDLSEPQMDIRNKELKKNFSALYDMINDIIERINDISKDADIIKPLEFVTLKLGDLANHVSDYLVYTFSTKSYTENMINYKLFLTAVHQINDILSKIKPDGK